MWRRRAPAKRTVPPALARIGVPAMSGTRPHLISMIDIRASGAIRLSASPSRRMRVFGGLVTSGPYRFVRHPIYAAILLFVWAGVASRTTLLDVGLRILVSAAMVVRIVSMLIKLAMSLEDAGPGA